MANKIILVLIEPQPGFYDRGRVAQPAMGGRAGLPLQLPRHPRSVSYLSIIIILKIIKNNNNYVREKRIKRPGESVRGSRRRWKKRPMIGEKSGADTDREVVESPRGRLPVRVLFGFRFIINRRVGPSR